MEMLQLSNWMPWKIFSDGYLGCRETVELHAKIKCTRRRKGGTTTRGINGFPINADNQPCPRRVAK